MTQMSRLARVTTLVALTVVAGATLIACSKKQKEVTQSAARVDGNEITVHQINYRLQRERNLRPEQMDAASRKVLEQLIDEELLVDKAEKDKLDKAPDAQQAMAAARRDVLAHAYIEQVGFAVPAPTENVLHRYYDDNPGLFSDRRIYTLHEFLGRVPADQIPALKALVDAGKPVADVTEWLKSHNFPFREQEGVHPAEQVPLGALKDLAALPDGHGLVVSAGDQVHITYVVKSESQPVAYERAKPAISQFLTIEARRKATETSLAALKSAAKIEYSAPYASLAASAPTLTTKDIPTDVPAPSPDAARVSLPDAGAASGVQVTLPAQSTSSVRVSLPGTAPTSSVQVTLPSQAPGVRVSLPTAASSVEVRLPPQTGASAVNK